MKNAALVLVSHALCPYVQRAAIVLAEKGVPFERRDIDLAHKPAWFNAVSPLSRTPVLLVGDQPIFESAVICEYLDETVAPRLHPAPALQRAQHRAWMEFGSALLNTIAAFYNAADDTALAARAADIRVRFRQLEAALGEARGQAVGQALGPARGDALGNAPGPATEAGDGESEGPYFAGATFSMVDAVFGPVMRYFDVFDAIGDFDLWHGLPQLQRWRAALAARPSVRAAVGPDYPALLADFVRRRGSALSRRMATTAAPLPPAIVVSPPPLAPLAPPLVERSSPAAAVAPA